VKLIELILQGVPGTQGVLRYPFQPGLNPWKQKGDLFRLEALVDVVASLFYPSQNQSTPLGPGKAQRAGITFEARGTTYRLTRDYVSKTLNLAQLDQGTKDHFTEISKDPHFILATLARAAQIPSQRVFRSLLVARHGASSSEEQQKWQSAERHLAKERAFEAPDPQARLAELRAEQGQIRTIHEREAKIDELQALVFQIEDQLRRFEEPTAHLKKIMEEYEAYAVFDAPGVLTPQVIQKLDRYAKVQEQRGTDLQTLEEKSKEWTEQLNGTPNRPPWNEPVAIGGVVAALIAFIGATFFRPWLWPLLAVFVLGLGAMSWGLWEGLRRKEKIRSLMQQIRGLDAEKAGIDKRFEIETGPVRKLLETVRIKDAHDVSDMLMRRKELQMQRKAVEVELAAAETTTPREKLMEEKDKHLKEIAAIQATLQNLPPASVDPNALEKEIRDLEATLASDTVPPQYEQPSTPASDDVNRLVVLAAELFDCPVAGLLRRVQQGVAANLTILTDKRFAGIEVAHGKLTAFQTSDGKLVAWPAVDPSAKAALLFAVQFTLWQLLAAERPLPLFLDLISGRQHEKLCALSLRAAQHVARQTQVVVLSA